MSDETASRRLILSWIATALLTFVPLLATVIVAAALEFNVIGTNRIEEACRAIHVHGLLDRVMRLLNF